MAGLPPLHALRAFEAAARHLSFARAAVELNLTPSAISHQIRHLEESLGRRLFERRHRGLELTAVGRVYFPLVRGAFEQLAQATVLIGGTGPELRNVLTISCMPSFAMVWLIPRLPAFQAAHPAIEVRLDTSSRFVDFARDGIDVGIRFGTGQWPGVAAEFLFSETLFPICAPALIAVAIGRGVLLEGPLASGRLVAPFEVKVTTSHAYYFACAEGAQHIRKVALFRAWLTAEVAAITAVQTSKTAKVG